MTDDDFAGSIRANILEAFREIEHAEERALLDALGAPIFARLMVERQMNPLGIERWEDRSRTVPFSDSTTLRVESRVLFVQTRPHPKELV